LFHENQIINLKKPKAMKTAKLTLVISLVLIIAGINFLYAGPTNTRLLIGSAFKGITYKVTVQMQDELRLCNTYLVQMVDEHGYSVAPAQVYQPGKTTYEFKERGSVFGVRIARLVESPAQGHINCTLDLVTAPDTRIGKFMVDKIYPFKLFPSPSQPSR
jgi:hypothetical protein